MTMSIGAILFAGVIRAQFTIFCRDTTTGPMSALGQKRHLRRKKSCLLWAKSDVSCLFDYLISDLLEMQRHGKAERLGGLEVDYEHELGWCLYRKIAWIFAF